MESQEIAIPIGSEFIHGTLNIVAQTQGLVIFAHGSGSSRFSKRNQFVANHLNQGNLSTLLFDLLTKKEDKVDQYTREFRFNIPLLAERLITVTKWLQNNQTIKQLNFGYFGSSTGAAAALIAAAQLPDAIQAVVSRGGRTDLASFYLDKIKAATLFIIGGADYQVIKLNKQSYEKLHCIKELLIVPDATHLFEEPGALEEVAETALKWFRKYLK